LRSIALGALYKKDVDVDAIAANELPALIDAVFDLVVADGDFDTAAYLRPQSKEQQLKASFTALSADVAALCVNNPAASLMYMLAGPGSIALFNSSNLASPEFKKYMGIGKNESALNWASHATSILMDSYHQNTSKPLIKCGVIGVLRRSKIKPDLIQNSYITALNATRSNIYKGKIMPIFFLTLTHVSYPTGAIRTYASILNILGIIEKLLQLKPENNQYNSGSIITKRFISTTISSVKTEYSVKNSDDDIDGDINSNESIDKDEIALLNPVIDATNKWLNEIHNLKSIHPSSILLGKIWNRIYFNFQKTSDYFQGTTKTYDLGLLMDIFAISVLNAFFIEEYDYHLLSTSTSIDDYIFDRTNPLSSPNIFNDRYIKILSTPEIFPFTYLLATCPLITGLIEPTRLNTIITKRESAKNHKNLDIFKIDNSGWDLVKSISIMYKKPPPTPATAPTASPSPSKNKQE
jgi:hypothetical protein